MGGGVDSTCVYMCGFWVLGLTLVVDGWMSLTNKHRRWYNHQLKTHTHTHTQATFDKGMKDGSRVVLAGEAEGLGAYVRLLEFGVPCRFKPHIPKKNSHPFALLR